MKLHKLSLMEKLSQSTQCVPWARSDATEAHQRLQTITCDNHWIWSHLQNLPLTTMSVREDFGFEHAAYSEISHTKAKKTHRSTPNVTRVIHDMVSQDR